MASDAEGIEGQLTALCRAKTGDPGATVGDIKPLPGHAGLSYSFVLRSGSDAEPNGENLVLRLAPPGVRISGPADVVRQARIMASLADTPVPVPAVRWFDYEPRWFGRPFSVVAFVDGRSLMPGQAELDQAGTLRLTRDAMRALTALHQVDWRSRTAAWGDLCGLTEELKRLDYLLDRPTLEPDLVALAPSLRERLLKSLPPAPQLGCVHGDFQYSNLLMRDGKLLAVIDWELAILGAVMIDLSWFCLFSDRESWVESRLMPPYALAPDELAELYGETSGRPVERELRWYRAFAGYRFGVITAFNLMLHRRGKRPDPLWEDIARSGRRLFERGLELLG